MDDVFEDFWFVEMIGNGGSGSDVESCQIESWVGELGRTRVDFDVPG